MSAADNLGNLFVALLAGIPLLIFVLFACCACLEASISAARRSYKPHLPTRVRFADEAEAAEADGDGVGEESNDGSGAGNDNRRQSRNPLLFGVTSNSRSTNRSGTGRFEGSGLMAHRFPNYRYSSVAQSPGKTTPPPVLVKSRTELGSGSIKSPIISPLRETQKLLEKEHLHRSTPTKTPSIGSPAYILPATTAASAPVPTPAPGRAVRQDASNSAADTQQISEKNSPTHLSTVLNYFDGSRRSSKSTPTTSPNFQIRPKSLFETCGPHVDPKQQQRYSTPSSPTMYAYQQRPQGPSNYSSMSYLPEVKTYLHFMEDDFSNRQRSHSFSGRSVRRSPRKSNFGQNAPQTSSSFALDALECSMIDDNASKISTPSSFGTTFLTPPGSTDQGSFKSPESGTPEWLLSSDVPPIRLIRLIDDEPGEEAVIFKQLSRSRSSIRTAFM